MCVFVCVCGNWFVVKDVASGVLEGRLKCGESGFKLIESQVAGRESWVLTVFIEIKCVMN